MATLASTPTGTLLARSKPYSIAENGFVKMCNRCGCTYTTQTRRQPVLPLCTDCKDVLPAIERRMWKRDGVNA